MKEDMKNFETALSELEALVRKLESDVAIDEATKAFAEGLTDIEKRVHNAFFLIFDINGNLYGEYQALGVDKTSGVISSHKLKLEVLV